MAAIDSTSRLGEVIRAQVAALRGSQGLHGLQPNVQRDSKTGRHADITSDVAARIRNMDAADPDRQRKALRFFLEAVMISEFGAKIAGDPQFGTMLDHVQQGMQADPELAAAAQQAAQALLKLAGR
jgi:hypothetical protein